MSQDTDPLVAGTLRSLANAISDAVEPMVGGTHGLSTRAQHPHAKSLDVMERLIERTLGVVADPFAGSGSTLLAAKRSGRTAIGVEIDQRYCEIAARRLSQGVLDFSSVSEGQA